MRMEKPFSRDQCAMAVSHNTKKIKSDAAMLSAQRATSGLQALDDHIASMRACGVNDVTVDAIALGSESGYQKAVRLRQFSVNAIVNTAVPLEKGQKIVVRILQQSQQQEQQQGGSRKVVAELVSVDEY